MAEAERITVPIDIQFNVPQDQMAMLVEKLDIKAGEILTVCAPEGVSLVHPQFLRFSEAVLKAFEQFGIEALVFPYDTQFRVLPRGEAVAEHS